MSTILDKITTYKKLEVAAAQNAFPLSMLKQMPLYTRDGISLKSALKKGSGVLAEHKRKSPSKSVINTIHGIDTVVNGYENGGVSGISVLTDTRFFGGSLTDLSLARAHCSIPILRKDFIIDPYQIHEAKAYGADAILLIAACLTNQQLISFSQLAKELGLEILVEIHNQAEWLQVKEVPFDIIGINNRNLKTFEVSIETSITLGREIPSQYLKISESGISDSTTVKKLQKEGFQGFLMGEHFMKTDDPGKAAAHFINSINS